MPLSPNRPNTFYGIRAFFMSDNLQGYHLQVVNHASSTQRF
ncbi:hypothetical protein [Moraxella bovis]|nr:hypothetical protein [Moraxella bovis]